jgi:hypothetical protein
MRTVACAVVSLEDIAVAGDRDDVGWFEDRAEVANVGLGTQPRVQGGVDRQAS